MGHAVDYTGWQLRQYLACIWTPGCLSNLGPHLPRRLAISARNRVLHPEIHSIGKACMKDHGQPDNLCIEGQPANPHAIFVYVMKSCNEQEYLIYEPQK